MDIAYDHQETLRWEIIYRKSARRWRDELDYWIGTNWQKVAQESGVNVETAC